MVSRKRVRIGLLHSQTGTMAISESPLLEAEILAIDEINAAGGVLRHAVDYVVEDGSSDPAIFASKAASLIVRDNISVLFGGWNSHSRKAVKRIVEKHNALFWYPMQYEGLEESTNIFYTGSCLNQQIMPALEWCWNQGWRTYYLVGSDYLYPITANKLIASVLVHKNGKVAGEKYLPLGHTDFSEVIAELGHTRPDAIINTLNGDSNIHFFEQLYMHGFNASVLPIISTSIAEQEFRNIGAFSTGHYACWTYFQCLQIPANISFVKRFRQRYGGERVVSDPVVMAYAQIYMWKQVVEFARSFDVDALKQAAVGQTFDTPAGRIVMMPNHHVTKKAYIGRSVKPGEFEIVGGSAAFVEPLPWQGIESLNFPSRYLIKEILGNFPETVNFNAELEKRVKERTLDLKRSEQRLRMVVENMPVMMAALADDSTLLAWNLECERVTGYRADELIRNPRSFEMLFPSPEDRKHFISDLTLTGGDFRDREHMLTCKDGSLKTISWSRVSSQYPIPGWYSWAIGSDISERRRTQEELRKTQRLESLGILAGGIAHDFNNLLGGIFGNVDLARGAINNTPEASKYLERALAAFGRATDLTKQLLTFSKGAIPQKMPVSLGPILEEAQALALSGSNIRCEIKASRDLHAVNADPNQLNQVFNNILINSRQSMPQGGKVTVCAGNRVVQVNAIPGLAAGKYAHISITDEGTGIPREHLPKVFDPFFTTKHTGSGLGLSTCHSIIRKHNGAIIIDSEQGRGTTVNIFLPICSEVAFKKPAGIVFHGKMEGRVLVMDDEKATREVAQRYLEILGFKVECVDNGKDAVRLFKERFDAGDGFDLVLLDLTIQGGIGGKQVMEAIRKIDPDITGIVISGYADSPILSEPEKYGFSAKIEKPFRKTELNMIFGNLLQKRTES